jgi:hypothetical protein
MSKIDFLKKVLKKCVKNMSCDDNGHKIDFYSKNVLP